MEDFVRTPVKAHSRIDGGVFHMRRPRPDHRGKIGEHGAEHEGAIATKANGQHGVAEVVHCLSISAPRPAGPQPRDGLRRARPSISPLRPAGPAPRPPAPADPAPEAPPEPPPALR